MSDSVTLLRSASGQALAKAWQPDTSIVPAARVKWFKAKKLAIDSLLDIYNLLDRIEASHSLRLSKSVSR